MYRVGLTGSIAAGKSTVARRLREHGVPVLDLDQIAHDIMRRGGSAFEPVVREFGEGVLDREGQIDRKRLGAIVFADPSARARLNAIVHPLVRDEESNRVAALEVAGHRSAVIEAALLIEGGQAARFDHLVVVGCDDETQIARLMARDGISKEQARQKIAAQMSFAQKRAHAHRVIDTSGTMKETLSAADELARFVLDRDRP